MKIDINSLDVIHNQAKSRFEIHAGSHVAELNYVLHGNKILFTHTGVPPALEGRGIGSKLVKAGLDYAKANKLKINTICWFVNGYIQRHPEAM
jgi:predicted GNAT family acetyltransferase